MPHCQNLQTVEKHYTTFVLNRSWNSMQIYSCFNICDSLILMFVSALQLKTCFHGITCHRKVLVIIRSKIIIYWFISLDIVIDPISPCIIERSLRSLTTLRLLGFNALCLLIATHIFLLGNILIAQREERSDIRIWVIGASIIRWVDEHIVDLWISLTHM